MEEEDKFDKELFRQRIKAKHREERLKAKAERRLHNRPEKDEEEDSDGDDGESDGSVADIIDALPDPDRIYGTKEGSEEEGDFYTGPPVARYGIAFVPFSPWVIYYLNIMLRKRSQLIDEEEDDSEDDDDNSESDEDQAPTWRAPMAK